MLTITIIVSGFLHLVLALFIFIKRKSSLTNILFSLLVLSELGWLLSNYASLGRYAEVDVLISVRLILFFVVIQNSLFMLFSKTFPGYKWKGSLKKLYAYVLFSVFVALLTISPLVFVSAKLENGLPVTTAGPGIILFILHAGFSILVGFKSLYLKLQTHDPLVKRQIKLLLLASFLNWVIVPITNFVLTSILKTTIFVELSPVYTLIFMGIIAYTIVAQKLFDIRAVVARSVAYFLIIGTLSTIYSISLFGAVNALFSGSDNEVLRQIFSVILTIPLLLLFQATKDFFDRVTTEIFYRDGYDAQAMIDELNKTLVNTVDLEALLTKSALIIQENLKTTYATFYIRETSYFPSRIIGAHRREPEVKGIDEIQEIVRHVGRRVYTVEEETQVEKEIVLNDLLRSNDFEIVARLVSTLDYEVKGVGLLFIGPKRSGSLFTKQDMKILEIIANELVIATENILRFEEIEKFNETLQKKIDDATRELRRSNEKLKALDEAKDEFVSMASHQLRTPLTSIKGYLSMVIEGDAGKISPTQKEMLSQAFFSSQRMVYLISDLLNVSRLKTGKFLIEAKPVYLPDVVETEINQLIDGAKSKNLTLSFTKPEKFATLQLDEMKTRQVIMNLTDNALYYTPSGGKVDVELKDNKDAVEFTVTDNGMGVPKEQQHKLFAKFYRADNARKARPDGTGLGLFMAKKVVIAQGGSIIFKSREGKGSTFGFSFPKAKLLVEPIDEKV